MPGVYHVVCHECAFEGLYEGATEADKSRESHAGEYDHRVSQLEIDRPKVRA